MPQNETLPVFENPPVAEVAFSIEFSPLNWWGVPYFGLYWSTIRAKFPKQFSAPPIPSSVENFERPAPPPVDLLNINFSMDPTNVRCSFISDSGNDAIQLQRDRLIRNWQRTGSVTEYPRYDQYMRPALKETFTGFANYVEAVSTTDDEKAILARQVEVTYVNDFEKGREWSDYPDLGGILKLWKSDETMRFLPSPYGMRAGISYDMPNASGRLHVFVQRAMRARDKQEILQMRLVARHRPESSSLDSILASADTCREWIVRGFTDLTTAKMHRIWGRI